MQELSDEEDSSFESYDYGDIPPKNRYATDQVPLTFDSNSTTLNHKGQGYCYLRGAKVDLEKRQCTLMPTFCADGTKPIKPLIIFAAKPELIQLDNGCVQINVANAPGLTREELQKYDPRVDVAFDIKSWASAEVIDYWLRKFDEATKSRLEDPKQRRLIQLDNYGPQATPDVQEQFDEANIDPLFSPGNCTDLCSVVDDGLGNELKKDVVGYFDDDFESSRERTNAWTDGKVSASERRVLFTKWYGNAWDSLTANEIIRSFKHCGVSNDIKGRENHKVKIQRLKSYEPPTKDSEPMKPLTEKEIEEWRVREKTFRDEN